MGTKISNTVYIGLGSNQGDRVKLINAAIDEIKITDDCEVQKASSFYESSPYGNSNQANFVNAVIKISTTLDYTGLLIQIKNIEHKLGRIKRERWGPREIDIDILFFNDLVFSNEMITLPHEGVIYRDFVLVPLCEIEPELYHPLFHKKVCEFLNELKTKNIIRKIYS